MSSVVSSGVTCSRSSGTTSTGGSGRRGKARASSTGAGRRHRLQSDRRADVVLRQEERERAADAGRAGQVDLAAEQARELAADRQPEAGAAVLPAGARIGLLEGFEDDLLLVDRNADAGVGHLEGDDAADLRQDAMVGIPPGSGRRDVQPHAALLGELERVRQQVLQHLLQALGVGHDRPAKTRIDRHLEREPAPLDLRARSCASWSRPGSRS